MSSPTYSRLPEFVSTDMDGETVLMSIAHGSYFGIGGIGTLIWEKLESPQTEDTLVDQIRAEFDVAEQECRRDVQAFLTKLVENGLIQNGLAAK